MKRSPLFLLFVLTGLSLAQDSDPLAGITAIDASTPREVQIALAESAAPKEIVANATVLVLGKKGYDVARQGTNGFTCMVNRQLVNTLEPECFDAEGSATTVKTQMFVEEQRAKEISEEAIKAAVEAGYKSGKFKAPSRPGIVYMLSKHNYVLNPATNKIVNFPGHLMFYAPYLTAKDLGSGPGAPYLTAPGKPTNLMVVVPR